MGTTQKNPHLQSNPITFSLYKYAKVKLQLSVSWEISWENKIMCHNSNRIMTDLLLIQQIYYIDIEIENERKKKSKNIFPSTKYANYLHIHTFIYLHTFFFCSILQNKSLQIIQFLEYQYLFLLISNQIKSRYR
jgi:hypothetical protein